MCTDFFHQFLLVMLIHNKLKTEAHETLSLLFHLDGVPLAKMCDNAKEMILGEFNRKLKEASCHLKQMEPFTSCSNAVEKTIMELKKHIKSGTWKRLCND